MDIRVRKREAVLDLGLALSYFFVLVVLTGMAMVLASKFFKDIQALLGATDDPIARRALTLMLVKALQRAAADPAQRGRLPAEAVTAIEALSEGKKR